MKLHPHLTLGQVVATKAAVAAVTPAEIQDALARHSSGDWGECGEEDAEANDKAVDDGERILSVYHTAGGVKFWIITDWDRSLTTVLLPGDY